MYLFQHPGGVAPAQSGVNLHSTMYLFQRIHIYRIEHLNHIYIPLCIYFNAGYFFIHHPYMTIYIPLCIYFNVLRLHGSAARVRIYIPLCIYFNKHTFKLSQYPDTFTFHYVSISTVTKRSAVPCIYLIYIPLCIYFN